MTLKERYLEAVLAGPGRTDRELADLLLGPQRHQAPLNQVARRAESEGLVRRTQRNDGLIGNYAVEPRTPATAPPRAKPSVAARAPSVRGDQMLQEDQVKTLLGECLKDCGWSCEIKWGRAQGIDVDARRRDQRLIIEVKGCGSSQAMRVNYFLGALGELFQRMDDPDASYALAFPDIKQFRGLWDRLPKLMKERTRITAFFVRSSGRVDEVG